MTSQSSVSKQHLEWPDGKRAYLTLDFECDYGTAFESNRYNAVRHSDRLGSLLEAHDVPMSCFLQTEILETCPDTVDPLLDTAVPIDVHAHSHTHPARGDADLEYEIAESVRRIRETFATDPIGFRFPDGAAEPRDYEVLAENDVAFSSSVFPSWRPGRFNNLQGPRTPYQESESKVIELPFTVYSDFLRIPVSLSYLKLFGAVYERLVAMNPPKAIVFDFHMHDLVVPSTITDLSLPYRMVYSRRKHDGFDILRRFIQTVQDQGYTFERVTDLYTEVAKDV